MHSLSLVLLSFVGSVFSSPVVPHVVHEKRSHLPAHWVERSRLDNDAVIPLRIAIKQQNLHRAEEFINDVSHPESPKYGQHWSAKDVAEMFAPSADDVQTVKVWLTGSGIEEHRIKISQSMGWLHMNATIEEAEHLLKTKYYVFEHTQSQTPHVACHEYRLPANIAKIVDFITPTVHFDAKVNPGKGKSRKITQTDLKRGLSRRQNVAARPISSISSPGKASHVGYKLGSLPKQMPADLSLTDGNRVLPCDQFITPNCLRTLYQFSANQTAVAKNSYGIVEYTPQSYRAADLDKFFSNFSSKAVGTRPKLDSIDGGVIVNNQSFSINGESNLDLQYAMALTYPQPVTLYQTGDLVEGASFNNFLDAIDGSYCKFEGGDDPNDDGIYPDPQGGYIGPDNCGGFAATNVISTSYSFNEADLSAFYEQRQCHEYMKLALQGVSVLYSSGDYGVAGNGGQCIDPKTGNQTAPGATSGKFNPSFPGTCPWITSVGATQVLNGTNIVAAVASGTQPEVACESVIRSGGGFSNVFPMPSYQAGAVKGWFKNHAPPYGASLFNNSQAVRAYPDISANGANYVVAVDGSFSLVFGTSASSPTLGAIITLINNKRIAAGKKAVGFLNPVLYKHPEILKDVTKGANPGCGSAGFSAAPGWDPVTGLGTPIYPKMLSLFMSLP